MPALPKGHWLASGVMADPNGADTGGMVIAPSDFNPETNTWEGSNAIRLLRERPGSGIAAILKPLGYLFDVPIAKHDTYDSIADKVLYLCEPGDGVCDAVTGNILSGHIHSYAYRDKDVFPQIVDGTPDLNNEDYAKFKKIFPDREPEFSPENAWRSDWSIWQDSRVRDWLGGRA